MDADGRIELYAAHATKTNLNTLDIQTRFNSIQDSIRLINPYHDHPKGTREIGMYNNGEKLIITPELEGEIIRRDLLEGVDEHDGVWTHYSGVFTIGAPIETFFGAFIEGKPIMVAICEDESNLRNPFLTALHHIVYPSYREFALTGERDILRLKEENRLPRIYEILGQEVIRGMAFNLLSKSGIPDDVIENLRKEYGGNARI